ncbi:translocation/assembly module TamB domain-containing protein [Pantoea sp. Nvir]|uniref:autotransporter assembly complex protein TamB n=1 Tax=Pantoea sp. Nvir TaxID=2576760 RepID=UPI0027F9216A|nr:translocation/assembly module TamB domain-containing protein [Pantoea sp. Nvir]CAJ0990862.1 Translocation and assembly module subunit TamB [Pantoea sp. Nvir]
MKLWKKVLISLLVFLLLLCGVVFFISTTPGLHLILNGAVSWVPGLSIKQVEGGWRNLTISGLHYEIPGVSVDVNTFYLAVNLNCLIHSSFCISDSMLKDVKVVVNSKKITTAQEISLPEQESSQGTFHTSYPIILSHLALHNINVKIDETTISLLDLTTGLQWQNRVLTFNATHTHSLLVALPKVVNKGVMQPKVQYPRDDEKSLGETLQAIFSKPLLPDLHDFNLPLDIDMQEMVGEQLCLTGDINIAVNRFLLKAKNVDHKLQLQTLDIDSNLGKLHASGEVTLADNWPVNLTINSMSNVFPMKGEKITLDLSGAICNELRVGLDFTGPVNVHLKAATQLSVTGLPLSLQLTSRQLRWPFHGALQYHADNFNYQFKGKATHYVMSLHTAVKGNRVLPAIIALDGEGNVKHFNINKLHISMLQGNVDLIALVDWSKTISWRSILMLSGINTARQCPNWPVQLDGKMTTYGSFYGGSIWQINVPQLQLKGKIKQNILNVEGALKGNGYKQWDIPGIKINFGFNELNVKGTLGNRLNLDANIDATHLNNTLPGLGGMAKGIIKLRGTPQDLQLRAYLHATNLRWQQIRMRSIELSGDIHSSDQLVGKVQLCVKHFKQDTLHIKMMQLTAGGNEKAHQLKFMVYGEPISGQLVVDGSFERHNQRWRGMLNNTHIATPVGKWRLIHTLAIDYLNAKQTVTITPHCWENSNAQFCVHNQVEVGPRGGHLYVKFHHFDLAMLKPFLPIQKTQITGMFSGESIINWTSTGTMPTGNILLKGSGVKVRQAIQGNTKSIYFNNLNFNVGLRDGQTNFDWLIRISKNGQCDGSVQIKDPQNRRVLGGNINIRNISLAMLNQGLMQGAHIEGKLNGNLYLGGSVKHPQIFGKLALQGVDVHSNFMLIDLTSANLNMVFNGMSSTLKGLVQTAQGNINLNGNVNWSKFDKWHAYITAQGSRVRIIAPPMVHIDVSPRLVFKATPKTFNLDGTIDVPWARITVHDLPKNSVGVSSDEVLLDTNFQPLRPKTASIPINSNLVIHIGNDVRLSAFGLRAKLNGDLKIVQDKTGFGLNGQINIPSGRFRAYGQDLIVRKGELQFSGLPDQPYINIEAIRNPETTENNVNAGLRITGLADEPQAEVFSEPAMPQQEAFSYLLRGQGLSSDSDNSVLTSSLIALGIAQSGHVIGKIGEMFGVSNLVVDTTGVGDNQQVQVSGYIFQGLQLKYSIGIFDSLATLTLRYRLMPKLYLEFSSSVNQVLDLLYQFEF